MNAEQSTEGRRVKKRYSAEDRERLIAEYQTSGKSRQEFADQCGIARTTFHGWFKKARQAKATPKLAEVEVTASAAPIEIVVQNGKRFGIHINGENGELAKLIRGVLAYRPGAA